MRFIGNLDRETQLNDCYAAADVFVFASRTETQGLVLLEAMAQGSPVVSTACLGTRSVLTPESGAMVVDEDKEDFARAVWRPCVTRPAPLTRARRAVAGRRAGRPAPWRCACPSSTTRSRAKPPADCRLSVLTRPS